MENKDNILNRVQNYLDTEKGRVLLNYLYSWGAAVVILGALFKLTHIAGANLMLFLGMGTEVVVFFISGFERPFIPEQPGSEDTEDDGTESGNGNGGRIYGDIYINGAAGGAPVGAPLNFSGAPAQPAGGASPVTINQGENVLDADSVAGVTQNYIDQMRELTAKLEKITEQSDILERSAAEIDGLSRNLVSLNKFYEMHLRSVSTQTDNIDKVKEQTARMVAQIEELNIAYARMLKALNNNTGSSDK